MALTNVTTTLTAAEKAREPRMLHVVAWFDGYTRGAYPSSTPDTFPRRLTTSEAREWRAGFNEGRRERVCLAWHGFTPCDHDHPTRMPTDTERST